MKRKFYSQFNRSNFALKVKLTYRRSKMKVNVLPSTTSALALLKLCEVVCCLSISDRKNEMQASAAFRDRAVSLENEM